LRKRESRRLSGDGLVLGAERLGNDEDCRKWNNWELCSEGCITFANRLGDIGVSVGQRCLETINSFKNFNVSMATVSEQTSD
jgi:hypothetical protein